jgi:hypothetical protein
MAFQVGRTEKDTGFCLHLIDDSTGKDIASCDDIDISPVVGGFYGGIQVIYPQGNTDNIPLEFAAYGTADPSVDVSGTMSNCDPATAIDEINPPANWTLYCYIVNPNPPCTLTVRQGTASQQVGGLTFGTS